MPAGLAYLGGAMFAALVTLTSRPGMHEALLAALTTYAEHVRREAGTLVFQVFTDADRPRAVIAWEIYSDRDALDEHSRSPERSEVGRQMDALVESSSISWLEPLAGHGLPISSPS
jgi:quinol monooxygenase YgiN